LLYDGVPLPPWVMLLMFLTLFILSLISLIFTIRGVYPVENPYRLLYWGGMVVALILSILIAVPFASLTTLIFISGVESVYVIKEIFLFKLIFKAPFPLFFFFLQKAAIKPDAEALRSFIQLRRSELEEIY